EIGPVENIYASPRHPYTQALLRSRLSMNPHERVDEPSITGDPPNPINPPSGCRFRTRCAFAESVCTVAQPPLQEPAGGGHAVACHMAHPNTGHSRAPRKVH